MPRCWHASVLCRVAQGHVETHSSLTPSVVCGKHPRLVMLPHGCPRGMRARGLLQRVAGSRLVPGVQGGRPQASRGGSGEP